MQANVRFTDNDNTNCLVAENPCFEESCKDPGSFCVARGAQFDCPCQPGYYKSNELCKAGKIFGGKLFLKQMSPIPSMKRDKANDDAAQVWNLLFDAYSNTTGFLNISNLDKLPENVWNYEHIYEYNAAVSETSLEDDLSEYFTTNCPDPCTVGTMEVDIENSVENAANQGDVVCQSYIDYCDQVTSVCKSSNGTTNCQCKPGYTYTEWSKQTCLGKKKSNGLSKSFVSQTLTAIRRLDGVKVIALTLENAYACLDLKDHIVKMNKHVEELAGATEVDEYTETKIDLNFSSKCIFGSMKIDTEKSMENTVRVTAKTDESTASTKYVVVTQSSTSTENNCSPNPCKDPNSYCNETSTSFDCVCKPNYYQPPGNSPYTCSGGKEFGGILFTETVTARTSRSIDQAENIETLLKSAYNESEDFIGVTDVTEYTTTEWNYVLVYKSTTNITNALISKHLETYLKEQNCSKSVCEINNININFEESIKNAGNVSRAVCLTKEGYCDGVTAICESSKGTTTCSCTDGHTRQNYDGDRSCSKIICASNLNCNSPYGWCDTNANGGLGQCTCMFGFAGESCNNRMGCTTSSCGKQNSFALRTKYVFANPNTIMKNPVVLMYLRQYVNLKRDTVVTLAHSVTPAT
ncbi:unnamed protein product [Clavelina lepadiformis]|uniref:EGF-like domain-containing protein n=1 Tax=Clavelina lepadiformis TaxID=159417 RepID=A0ABP0H2A6_CLALP